MSKGNITNPAVEIIPATKRSVQNAGQLKGRSNIRVAAYCRVSTGDESQQTSYTHQKAYYTEFIRSRQGWHFAGIYADEALSGTSRAHRAEFNRMMEDALRGKLDYIVTKSISRFARNTVDTLHCVRQLKMQNPPVGIYFEKENIDTLDATGELILTILSALAQDESRSISENIRWTFQKNFQSGKPQINLKRMLGYDQGPNEEWIINPEQAELIRYIFHRFLNGLSAHKIAGELNRMGKRTINGRPWTAGGVLVILRNEKYVGDLEMQKTITKNFLTHQSTRNRGEAPKYYVKNHHAAIIDRLTWDRVQAALVRKGQGEGRASQRGPLISPFSNLRCGAVYDGHECGSYFFRLTYSAVAAGYSDERCMAAQGLDATGYRERYMYAFPVWRCRCQYGRRRGEARCPSELLHECAMEQSFMEMLYSIKKDYETRGSDSHILRLYRAAHAEACRQAESSRFSQERMEMLDMQLREAEETLKTISLTEDAEYADSLRRRAEELMREKASLKMEQEAVQVMEHNFAFFLQCLAQLPEKNAAGLPLRVNGFCGDLAPDYLRFEKGMYKTFIQRGVVRGDAIEYLTSFGVRLTSWGNRRTLRSFLGFRRGHEDGTLEELTNLWQISGKRVQYSRKKR